MDLELNEKVAVVTGASKGIGLAVVHALAGEGAHVESFGDVEQRRLGRATRAAVAQMIEHKAGGP